MNENRMKPISRTDGLVVQYHDKEVLIYDLETNKAFCLNKTSSLIWASCDGMNTVSEISQITSKKLNLPVSDDLVWIALDQFKQDKLISNCEEIESSFGGMSRRDVIKKVGLTSLVALPIIASLAAPVGAQTASCTPGGSCTCVAPNGGSGNICTTTSSTCNSGCVCRYANNGNTNGSCGF